MSNKREWVECDTCGGFGSLDDDDPDGLPIEIVCPVCRGRGTTPLIKERVADVSNPDIDELLK